MIRPKNFRSHWHKLKKDFLSSYIFLFIDYDGTLTPIAASPSKAVFSSIGRIVLRKILRCRDCRVSIISGRTLADIRRMVKVSGITYAGNHGLEIDGPGIHFKKHVPLTIKAAIKKLKTELAQKVSAVPGAWLEDKGGIGTIHFRAVAPDHVFSLARIIRQTCKPYLSKRLVRVSCGHKVFEIRPFIEWDKGKAAGWILSQWKHMIKRRPILSIYIGDDQTDEDAFRGLGSEAITIRVGSFDKTKARYFVREPKDVVWVLREILTLKGLKKNV